MPLFRRLRPPCSWLNPLPWVGCLLLSWLIGCSRGPDYAPVSGTVKFRGVPLKAGGITFEPSEGRSAFGSIVDGKIVEVSTHRAGDGVRVGPVRIGIQSTTNLGSPVGPHTPLIPPHYFDPNTSQLTAEIRGDGPNELQLDLP